ncbi:MAG: ribosome small subunit-dependent GTPase A [Chloroflexota bacterium]|nr:ribosome small subunit-dependent GTPase A [Chloroflexota bacterium]
MVIRTHGGHYYVQANDTVFDCGVRGRLKQRKSQRDLVVIGDRVRWSPIEQRHGIIEQVLTRTSKLSRRLPHSDEEQVLVANLDQVLVVFAVRNPPLSPFVLDRYLVACEAAHLPVIIIANKIDLLPPNARLHILERYRRIGYECVYTSAETGENLDTIRTLVLNRISALVGPSGTGKSSILNAIWPHVDQKVGEISDYHDQGRHTTVVPELLNPEPGVYIADTPGLRRFHLWDVDPEQLEAFFPEMEPYLNECHFATCTHMHEPNCAVRRAVDEGAIDAERYESYQRLFQENA